MKFKTILTIVFINIFLFIPIIAPSSQALYYDDEYQLLINNEEDVLKIQWEIKGLEVSLLEKLENESSYASKFIKYHKNDKFYWEVSMMVEDRCCWWLKIKEYSGYILISDDTILSEYKDEFWIEVNKDPSQFCSSWFNQEYNRRNIWLIPNNVENYLEEFANSIPLANLNNYDIERMTLYEDLRNETTHGHSCFDYNYSGILNGYSLFYDNETALEISLVQYDLNYNYLPPCGLFEPYIDISYLFMILFIFFVITILNSIIYLYVRGTYFRNQLIENYKEEN